MPEMLFRPFLQPHNEPSQPSPEPSESVRSTYFFLSPAVAISPFFFLRLTRSLTFAHRRRPLSRSSVQKGMRDNSISLINFNVSHVLRGVQIRRQAAAFVEINAVCSTLDLAPEERERRRERMKETTYSIRGETISQRFAPRRSTSVFSH